MTDDERDRLRCLCIVRPLDEVLYVLEMVCVDCASDGSAYTSRERRQYRALAVKLQRAASYARERTL